MPLWLHELLHFTTYSVMYLFVSRIYLSFKKFAYFLVGILSAIFVDLDHLIDYLLYTNFQRFDLSEFLSGEGYDALGVGFVIFHGWEYVILLITFGFIIKNKSVKNILYVLALGLFAHLFFDTLANGLPDYFYFITLRASHNYRFSY